MTQQEYQRIVNKQRHLPLQLERARQRVRHLEAEAVRLGLAELVEARA